MTFQHARETCLNILRHKTNQGKRGKATYVLADIISDCLEDSNAIDDYREIFGEEFAHALMHTAELA